MIRNLPALVLLVCLFTAISCLPAEAVTRGDVRSFLLDEYPYLNGTIVTEREGQYYARIQTNLDEATVSIVRSQVITRDGSRRLVNRPIGTIRVAITDTRTANLILNLPRELKKKVQLGDKLRLPARVLRLHNKSELDTDSIIKTVRSLNSVDTVVTAGHPVDGNAYRLIISPDRLVLSLTGAKQKRIAERKLESRSLSGTSRVRLAEIGKLPRIIRDLAWVEDTESKDGPNLVLAAESRLGFATGDTALTDVTWTTLVNGRVLDVSVVPLGDGSGRYALALVRNRSGTVRSDYYTLDLASQSLEKHWTRSNVWIHETAGEFFQQTIGIQTPFEPGLRRVTLSSDGLKQRKTMKTLTENYIYSPSYLLADSTVLAVNRDGKLELFRNGKRITQTSERYGGSPRKVTARRGESVLTLNPEFVSWKTDSGHRRMLVPRNVASGLTAFRGLTYYESSRLYLLETRRNGFERLWESNRLPGFLSGITYGNGAAYLGVVNDDENATRLYRLDTDALR